MDFTPIRTERLLLRLPRPTDAGALAQRRSDPRVAEFQNWIPPYPLDRARVLLDGLVESAWLADGEWSMLTIADPDDTTIFGDLALHPTWDGRSIEIGYSLAASAWRNGYATEAVEALIERLWSDSRVTRLSAMLHPDNVASEQVLERSGFRFEGRTRLSYWVGDDNSDDLLYGMTRTDRRSWTTRPRHRPDEVHLAEVGADNIDALISLTTHHSQERFVPPVTTSLARALRPEPRGATPMVARPFGIVSDDELVGFAMMTAPGESNTSHEPELARFLIDRRHQRRGVGTLALDAVIAECRRSNASALIVRWREGRGSSTPFWRQAGFVSADTQTRADVEELIEARLVVEAS